VTIALARPRDSLFAGAAARLKLPVHVIRPRVALSLAVVLLVAVCTLFPDALAPDDPLRPHLGVRLAKPALFSDHLLGTDSLGRDVLSRIIFGARVSAVVGLAAVVVAGTLGVAAGLLAGYYRRVLDPVISYFSDLSLAVPYLVLAIAIVVLFGGSLHNVVIVLSLTTWVIYMRVVRAEVLILRESEFVQASRALGAGDARILLRHILPHVGSSIIVIATQQLGAMILFEAALSFLGLGIQPPTPSWGSMVADGRLYLESAWWVSTIPGLAILLSVIAVNWLGDSLRVQLDPHKTIA
jgi:peptide/nickel transport system permease protein